MNARAALADVLFRPQLLSLLKPHLSKADVRNVRLASTAARAAVNATVTTVELSPSSPRLCTDLADAFPEAKSLQVALTYNTRGTGDLTVLLGLIGSTSAAFIRKLRRLEVNLRGLSATERTATTLYRFLSRCTSLQELRVAWARNANLAAFCGQGTNAEEQRVSMQAQLAAMRADPVFLAPASWPAHACLQEFEYYKTFQADGVQYPAATAALQTTSLHRLQLAYDLLDGSDPWEHIGCVARSLSSLRLGVSDGAPDAPQAAMYAAVAQLTSLVELDVELDLLESAVVDGQNFYILPPGWSRLACLTQLHVRWGFLDVSNVPCFPALQALRLWWCSSESLSQLFQLTSLTSITFEDGDQVAPALAPVLQQGASAATDLAVPQQWKTGMRTLEWGFSWHNLDVIAQLSALTCLMLSEAQVGPTLACSLAGLSALKALTLWEATVDERDGDSPIAAAAFRPSFGALATFDFGSLAVLTTLARWTNVPSQLQLNHCLGNDADAEVNMLDASCCGNGWLQALLTWQARKGRHAPIVNIFLRNDSGVEALAQEAGGLPMIAPATDAHTVAASTAPSVVLASRINAAGVCKLFEIAQRLPSQRLSIIHEGHLGPSQPVVQLLPALLSGHVQQLQGGRVFERLKQLHLGNCSLLTACDMGILAGALPNLVVLQLDRATGATDVAVCAFVACRILAAVSVTGCTRVTAAAATLLLTMLPKLESLHIANVCACESKQACQQLLELARAAA